MPMLLAKSLYTAHGLEADRHYYPIDPVHLKKAGHDTAIIVPAKAKPAARP